MTQLSSPSNLQLQCIWHQMGLHNHNNVPVSWLYLVYGWKCFFPSVANCKVLVPFQFSPYLCLYRGYPYSYIGCCIILYVYFLYQIPFLSKMSQAVAYVEKNRCIYACVWYVCAMLFSALIARNKVKLGYVLHTTKCLLSLCKFYFSAGFLLLSAL